MAWVVIPTERDESQDGVRRAPAKGVPDRRCALSGITRAHGQTAAARW